MPLLNAKVTGMPPQLVTVAGHLAQRSCGRDGSTLAKIPLTWLRTFRLPSGSDLYAEGGVDLVVGRALIDSESSKIEGQRRVNALPRDTEPLEDSMPPDPTLKTCSVCQAAKAQTAFSKHPMGKDGLRAMCRDCELSRRRAHRERNADEIRIREAAWRAANQEAERARHAAYRSANTEKIRAANAAYRLANLEHERTRGRAYNAANRERVHAYGAAWRAANPDKKRAAYQAYRAENLDRIREYRKAYIAAYPERVRDAQLAYYVAHREQARAKVSERRARLAGLPSERVLLSVLFERDKGICGICGKRVYRNARDKMMRPSHDHILPVVHGGANTYANAQLAHLRCNLARGHRGAAQLRLEAYAARVMASMEGLGQ